MKTIVINKDIFAKNSKIHSNGVFTRIDIEKGTKIIEYIGEKITKEESEKRCDAMLEMSKSNPQLGAVYIFELDDEYDIDGNFDYNFARLINHSCSPNCEIDISDGHIWIVALRDIKAGEELTYNYEYDLEDYKDHPCKCGSKNCVGYILAEEHWPEMKKKEGLSDK
jgi:hypothetical protein